MREYLRCFVPSAREGAIAGGLYLLLAMVMLYGHAPWPRFGSAAMSGDSQDAIFFLAWGHKVLLAGEPGRMFEVPISYPLPHAGALTDITPGLVVLSLPLRLLSSNPVWIFNATRIVCAAANALAFFLLARSLKLGRVASWIGGASFAFSGYMMVHLHGHVTMFAVFGVPLATATLLRYLRGGRLLWAGATAVLLAIQGTLSSRLGVLCLAVLLGLLLFHGPRPWRGRRWWHLPAMLGGLALGMALAAAAYAPALELRTMIPPSRNVLDAVGLSCDLLGYFTPEPFTLGGGWWERTIGYPQGSFPGMAENRCYWGWPVYLGVLAGLLVRRWKDEPFAVRPWLLLVLVGIVFSFGPFLWVWGELYRVPLPWQGVVQAMPVLETFRAVARFSLLAGLGLNVLFVLAMHRLGRWSRAILPCILVAVLLDSFPIHDRSFTNVPRRTEIGDFLATLEQGSAVLHLPCLGEEHPLPHHLASFVPTANSIRVGTHNPYFHHLVDITRDFPNPEAVAFLRSMGINTIITRDAGMQKALADDPAFEPLTVFAYHLRGVAPKPATIDRELLTQWDAPFTPTALPGTFDPERKPILLLRHPGRGQTWYGHQVTDLAPTKGVVRFAATGATPYLTIDLDQPIAASAIADIQLRFRFVNPVAPIARPMLYWDTEETWFSEDRRLATTVPTSREWQVLRWTPTPRDHWDADTAIKRFRIDLANPALPGDIYEIDELRVYGH